jgi:hypothetical protein
MSFEVKECTLNDVAPHPTLAGRTRAKVNVRLQETRASEVFEHNLVLRVWAATNENMTPAEIRTALLAKAATILRKTVSLADIDEHKHAAQ